MWRMIRDILSVTFGIAVLAVILVLLAHALGAVLR